MKAIFVPTDFSDRATNAVVYAARLALKYDAKVVLGHGYRMPHADSTIVEMAGSVLDTEKDEDLEELVRFIKNRDGLEAVNFQTYRAYATALEIIEEGIEKFSPDLIVMGTKGSGGLNSIFGSNTAAAILQVKCPILVVPEGAAFKEPTNILFATDYQVIASNETLQPLAHLAATYNSNVSVLTVNEKEDYSSFLEAMEHLENEYRDSLGVANYSQHHIHDISVEEGIMDFITTNEVDMLVMVTHDRGFFSRLVQHSHTKRMAMHTKVPMLTLHEAK